MRRKIGYLTQWWVTNIGNAFIDMGAEISIFEAIRDSSCDLVQVSAFSMVPDSGLQGGITGFMYNIRPLTRFFWKLFSRYLEKNALEKLYEKIIKASNTFNLAEVVKVDYFVFSGCVLTIPFFKIFDNLFNKLKSQGTKIILYGCGGSSYSDFEINFVRNKLKEIQPYALITRDSLAFQNYSDLAEHSFDGIDCAFFVNKLPYKRIELNMPPYVVLSFDEYKNKRIEKKLEKEIKHYKIIKASHKPFPQLSIFGAPKHSGTLLVSDSPHDYLILYAHAKEVHTDRVHACVPALSFGTPCRLYSETPRAMLFEKVCTGDITKRVVYPRNIERIKEKQVAFLSQIIE